VWHGAPGACLYTGPTIGMATREVTVADRRTLGLLVRTGASIVMLGVLVSRVNLSSITPDWDSTTLLWLLAALAVTAVGVVIATIRWQAVLTGLDVHERLPTLLHHALAGMFVGNFRPSTVGGDVLRVRRLAAHDNDTATAFASVVLDRLSGMLVLPLITLGALASNSGLRELGGASILAAALSITTLLFLGFLLVTVSHPEVGRRLTGTSRWREFASAVHLGADRLRRHPPAIAGLVLTAFAYQLAVVFAALLAARALHIHEVGLTAALAFVPAVAIAQSIPISIGGFGLREGAFVLFLDPLGVSTGHAVALGLFVYALTLIVSLAGAPSFAVGSRPKQGEPA
jgi:uncharacterized membrane protein YbhN (UPF0104 family)